jgi:cell division protein FtsL
MLSPEGQKELKNRRVSKKTEKRFIIFFKVLLGLIIVGFLMLILG